MPGLVAGGFVAAHDEVGEAEPGAFGAFQFVVEGDVLGFLHAHAGVSQGVQAVVGKIGDLFLGPLLGVGEVGLEVLDHGGEGGAALAVNGQQVDAADLGDAAGGSEGFQVKGGVPQSPGAGLLAGGAAIGLDLAREDAVAVVVEGGLLLGVVFDESGDGGDLGSPPGGVIVAGALFAVGVVAGGEPVEVVLKPLFDGGLFLGIPVPGLGEELHPLDGTNEDASIDDAGAASVVEVADRLGIVQVGIHAALGIDDPGIDVAGGALGVAR